MLDLNKHVYVQEDGVWAIKGRYSVALDENEPIKWKKVNGELILPILMVCFLLGCLCLY